MKAAFSLLAYTLLIFHEPVTTFICQNHNSICNSFGKENSIFFIHSGSKLFLRSTQQMSLWKFCANIGDFIMRDAVTD